MRRDNQRDHLIHVDEFHHQNWGAGFVIESIGRTKDCY